MTRPEKRIASGFVLICIIAITTNLTQNVRKRAALRRHAALLPYWLATAAGRVTGEWRGSDRDRMNQGD
jgi:hypothetical protein